MHLILRCVDYQRFLSRDTLRVSISSSHISACERCSLACSQCLRTRAELRCKRRATGGTCTMPPRTGRALIQISPNLSQVLVSFQELDHPGYATPWTSNKNIYPQPVRGYRHFLKFPGSILRGWHFLISWGSDASPREPDAGLSSGALRALELKISSQMPARFARRLRRKILLFFVKIRV